MITFTDNLSPSLEKILAKTEGGRLTESIGIPVANMVLGNARVTVPVKTGNLQSSGRVEVIGDAVVVKFGGRNNVDYAQTVHERYPWLAEATELVEDQFLTDEILKVLDI